VTTQLRFSERSFHSLMCGSLLITTTKVESKIASHLTRLQQKITELLIHGFGRPFVKRFALCYRTPLSDLIACRVTLLHSGQTVGWVKMQLGTELGLGPGHIVLDGNPASSYGKGARQPPLFGPCLLWPNGRPSRQLLSSCHSRTSTILIRVK